MLWGGMLGTVAVWGICFRLTFWELSWDVMEPVTYFIGSGLGKSHCTGWPTLHVLGFCMHLTPLLVLRCLAESICSEGAVTHAAHLPIL